MTILSELNDAKDTVDVPPDSWCDPLGNRLNNAKDTDWDRVKPLCPPSEHVEKLIDKVVLSDDVFDKFTKACVKASSRDTQIGGDHYKNSEHQPLEIVLDTEGYEAFRGACLVKVYKYLQRKKLSRTEDYRKAQHIISWLVEVSQERDDKYEQEERDYEKDKGIY